MAKTRLPDFPVPGGCACGAVRYELTAPPFALFACHCADCQIPQYVCGECGTRIYTVPPGPTASLTLRPGTLDNTSWLRPVAAFWRSSAQPHVTFDDDMLVFDTQPDDFMPVVRAWRANLDSASSNQG